MTTLKTPSDYHLHFREGDMMKLVVPETAKTFGRGLVMPNTKKPILGGLDAEIYYNQIKEVAPNFEPLMTIKLDKSTTPEVIKTAAGMGVIAAKFYPEGATTNATGGYASPSWYFPCFEAMQEEGMVLCLHGEVPSAFSMDREQAFFTSMVDIRRNFRRLRIVLEHITTAAAFSFIRNFNDGLTAATITAHHLWLTLDDIVGDKLNPHAFCKPIPKSPSDREALIMAATMGDPRFFFGSDSAPHLVETKECGSGCAGVFSAPCALETVAEIFAEHERGRAFGLPSTLEKFVCTSGNEFYGLDNLPGEIELVKDSWVMPEKIGGVVPFRAGETIPWRVVR